MKKHEQKQAKDSDTDKRKISLYAQSMHTHREVQHCYNVRLNTIFKVFCCSNSTHLTNFAMSTV